MVTLLFITCYTRENTTSSCSAIANKGHAVLKNNLIFSPFNYENYESFNRLVKQVIPIRADYNLKINRRKIVFRKTSH